MSDLRPIGVFDSGIGGLTVVHDLLQRLPNEAITYFGDTARVPYGSKSPETVRRYADEAATFLMTRDIKLLVIACNTATAHAADDLATRLPIPVVGVVQPGARAAVRASRTHRIGVIGTVGTIRSGAYDLAVRKMLPDARVYAQPCPLFVPLVEEGWRTHRAARLVAEEYLRPLKEMNVDVLVLGCTHYPLLRHLISDIMGPDVRLVDSATETAIDVAGILDRLELRRAAGEPPVHSFAASDAPQRFRAVGRTFVGEVLHTVEHVDIEAFFHAA